MGLEITLIKNDLPLSYRWFRANGLKRLVPWHFGDDPAFIDAWRKEYLLEVDATSDVMPFAFRQDMDTMAAFVVIDGMIQDHVTTMHLSWVGHKDMYWLRDGEQPPALDLSKFPSFSDWVTTVMVPESIEWMNEEDLDEMKTGTWPNFAR
jgi:hypothetical protein